MPNKTSEQRKRYREEVKADPIRSEKLKQQKRSYDIKRTTDPILKSKRSKTRSKRYVQDPAVAMLARAKARAKAAGYKTDLDVDYIRSIMPKYCPLLNIKLQPNVGTGTAATNSPSIDKIYPEKRYMKGNVMVISNLANTIKNNATPQQLIALARNLKYIVDDLYPYGPESMNTLGCGQYEPPVPPVPPVPVPVGAVGEEGPVTVEVEPPVGLVPVVGGVLHIAVVEKKINPLQYITLTLDIPSTNKGQTNMSNQEESVGGVPHHSTLQQIDPLEARGYHTYSGGSVYIANGLLQPKTQPQDANGAVGSMPDTSDQT